MTLVTGTGENHTDLPAPVRTRPQSHRIRVERREKRDRESPARHSRTDLQRIHPIHSGRHIQLRPRTPPNSPGRERSCLMSAIPRRYSDVVSDYSGLWPCWDDMSSTARSIMEESDGSQGPEPSLIDERSKIFSRIDLFSISGFTRRDISQRGSGSSALSQRFRIGCQLAST